MKNLFTIFLFLIGTSIAFGCNCDDKPTIKEAWKYSRQIFIGRVIESNLSNEIYGNFGEYLCFFTIEIEELFKGELYKKKPEYIYDETGRSTVDWDTIGYYNKRTFLYRGSSSCDYWFEKGKRYLIYAYENDNFLRASICSRTIEIKETSLTEIEELRELKKEETKIKDKNSIPEIRGGKNDELNLFKEQLKKKEKENQILKYCIISLISMLLLWKLIRFVRKKNEKAR
jgi:hypothetical protein